LENYFLMGKRMQNILLLVKGLRLQTPHVLECFLKAWGDFCVGFRSSHIFCWWTNTFFGHFQKRRGGVSVRCNSLGLGFDYLI